MRKNLESTIDYIEKMESVNKEQILHLLKTMEVYDSYQVENVFEGTKDLIRYELNELPNHTKENFATILTYIHSKIDVLNWDEYKDSLLSIS